jgi:PEP-CTERM motif
VGFREVVVQFDGSLYSYVGNPFNESQGGVAFNCPPQCNVSGSFTIDGPLTPTSTPVEVDPSSFHFTDGLVNFTQANSLADFSISVNSAGDITDWSILMDTPLPDGGCQLLGTTSAAGPGTFRDFAGERPDCNLGSFVVNFFDPGTWTKLAIDVPPGGGPICLGCDGGGGGSGGGSGSGGSGNGSTSVPEPSSLVMFAVGLLGVGAAIKHRG